MGLFSPLGADPLDAPTGASEVKRALPPYVYAKKANTLAMVKKYAGQVWQEAHAKEARKKRDGG